MPLRHLLLALLAALAAPHAKAQPLFDASLNYFARDNVAGNDNDIIRSSIGASFDKGAAGYRLELDLGVRNNFFEGSYPLDSRIAALRYYRLEQGSWGYGGRLSGFEGGEFGVEAMVYRMEERGPFTGRALFGLQGITGTDPFADSRNFSAFAVAEIAYYPTDALSLRASATLDDLDILGTIGAELGFGRAALFADWTLAANRYRTDQYYNDFVFGLRITSPFTSLRARERGSQSRAFLRPVDPQ